MRGREERTVGLFSYVGLEERIPSDHPLRAIRGLADEALASLNERFEQLYSRMGRPSIPPEMLLRATLLQAFFSVRSERMLMEQIDYNLLFRWFVGLGMDGDGITINRKKTQRLYREEGLTVRRRKGRKRAVGARAPAPVPALPNQRWSLDFVHDQMATGCRFRILNVVDDVTRECLAAVPDTSISGKRVVRELTYLIARRGKPGMIVSDNGTELTSNAVLEWCSAARSNSTTPRRVNPPRTHSSRASTAGCVTSCSTRRSSPALPMPAKRSPLGSMITTPGGHTPHWDTPHRRPSPPN